MGTALPKHQPQVIHRADVERYRAVLTGKVPLDVMLLGNSGVGKTTMIQTFTQSMCRVIVCLPSRTYREPNLRGNHET